MISFVDTTLRCPSAGDHCALDQGKEGGGGRTLTIDTEHDEEKRDQRADLRVEEKFGGHE